MHPLTFFTLLIPLLVPTTAISDSAPLVPRGGTLSLSNGPKHLPPNVGPPIQPLASLDPSSARGRAPSRPHRIKCHGRFELSCQQKCYCTPQNTVACDTYVGGAEVGKSMRETGHSRELAQMLVNLNVQTTMALCVPSCYCGPGRFRFTDKQM